ncbi:hypothetical protein JCM1841_002701, partial [Sporobolomyces salmonicolor]
DVRAALEAEVNDPNEDPVSFDQDEPLDFGGTFLLGEEEDLAPIRSIPRQSMARRASTARSAARRPTAESFFPLDQPIAGTSSTSIEPHEDDNLDAELDAVVLRHLSALPHRADPTLPKNVVRTHELAVRYGANSARELVRAQARASRAYGIPADVCEAIIRNEYVDLGKIHAHDPALEHNSRIASELPDLFVQGPSPSSKIADAHSWLVAFDKLRQYTLRFYPHRADELRVYRDWFSGRVARDPERFATYRDYDAHYRQHLGEPGFGHTLEDATKDAAAISTFFAALPSSAGGGSTSSRRSRSDDDEGSSSSKRPKNAWPRDVCRKFNFNAAHDETECKSFRPPRRHVCRDLEEERSDEDVRMELLLGASVSDERPGEDYRLPGTGPTPRLRRALNFPSSAPPTTPAVDRTYSDPPLPSVPRSILEDPTIAGTIARAPHLFDVDTPFRVNAVAALLRFHPNRPLIDSVLKGLRHGFWPGFEGEMDHSSLGPDPIELSEDDHDFIAMQLNKDYEKGYLSMPFAKLLPGMVVSPMFVVRIEGRKPRAVVDQTASGLNDGVDRDVARVTYDTIAELGRLLRYRRRRSEDKDGVLWRSDVSGAFRTLPVAVQWQVRQVHRSRRRDRHTNRYETIYYVDRRVVFGGRFSPRLWCTVMNVILAGVKQHLGLEFPLAYVDDAFGLDTSGFSLPVTNPTTGETRSVPCDQARLLLVWNFVGCPWEWDKQLSGKRLVVLGHLVDSDALTVSLPEAAKQGFADSVANFLAPGKQPLVAFQRLAGYGNWICTSLPFAKFALVSIYEKMRGKSRRNGSIWINTAVRRNLAWLVRELSTAPPLDLLDPALEPWGFDEADLVLFTDACLRSNDPSCSGLGFWYASNQRRVPFFARLDPPLQDIILAEALAVHSAIEMALAQELAHSRLLICTDSSASVYAYDAGRGEGPLLELVRDSYRALAAAGIDLRIRHVQGERNKTADTLSRVIKMSVSRGKKVRARVRFSAHSNLPPSAKRPPPPSLAELVRSANELLAAALESSTIDKYRSALRLHWFPFLRTYRLSAPPSPRTLVLFITFLQGRLTTLNGVLSAVSWFYRLQVDNWGHIIGHPLVAAAKTAFKKRHARKIRRAPPFFPEHVLAAARHALRPGAVYDDFLFAFMVVVGFGALLRLAEMTRQTKADYRDPRKYIRRDSVAVVPGEVFSFHLPYHKADRLYAGSGVTIVAANSTMDFNFVTLCQAFLRRRDAVATGSPYLFVHADGSLPSRSFFQRRLALIDPSLRPHGMRAGGATFLASRGARPDVIKRLGRWSGDGWTIYLRDNPAVAAAVQRVELAQ